MNAAGQAITFDSNRVLLVPSQVINEMWAHMLLKTFV